MPDFSQTQFTTQNRYWNWLLLNALVGALLLWYIGVLVIVGTGILIWVKPRRAIIVALNLFSICIGLILLRFTPYFFSHLFLPWESWLYWLPFLPLISTLMQGAIMFSRFVKPKSLQEQLAAQERQDDVQSDRLSQDAGKSQEPREKQAVIRLGAKIKGDRFPDYLGIHFQDNWLCLNEDVLDQHIFLLGTTGAGKSETIKRLVYEIMHATDRHVYLVDGKGDEKLANEIRSLGYHYGRGISPVFKLGFDKHGAIYNGFRGQPTDIYNRLCALIGVKDAEGGAQYYADINRDLLQLICYAPQGPPRNFETLRARISKRWLSHAYKENALELEHIEALDEQHLQGLGSRIRPLAREFGHVVGDDGFALEDTPCAIFSLRVQSVGDSAQRFLNFLVEDLKDYIGKRQKHPAVLIIDEFGQFENQSIISLLSLARSTNLSVILATQDVASLQDEQTKRLILANARTKILMATDFPEDVALLAGTTYQIESSMQLDEGDATGMGSARVQHTFKIDMNEVARLEAGQAFLIRQRHVAKISVRRIGEINLIPEQLAEKRKRKVKKGKTKQRKKPRAL